MPLSVSQGAGAWISDFVKSDNPRFKGKSKKKRTQMALAAFYSKKRGESIDDVHSPENIAKSLNTAAAAHQRHMDTVRQAMDALPAGHKIEHKKKTYTLHDLGGDKIWIDNKGKGYAHGDLYMQLGHKALIPHIGHKALGLRDGLSMSSPVLDVLTFFEVGQVSSGDQYIRGRSVVSSEPPSGLKQPSTSGQYISGSSAVSSNPTSNTPTGPTPNNLNRPVLGQQYSTNSTLSTSPVQPSQPSQPSQPPQPQASSGAPPAITTPQSSLTTNAGNLLGVGPQALPSPPDTSPGASDGSYGMNKSPRELSNAQAKDQKTQEAKEDLLTCPYCGKTGHDPYMHERHFNHCPYKPGN